MQIREIKRHNKIEIGKEKNGEKSNTINNKIFIRIADKAIKEIVNKY